MRFQRCTDRCAMRSRDALTDASCDFRDTLTDARCDFRDALTDTRCDFRDILTGARCDFRDMQTDARCNFRDRRMRDTVSERCADRCGMWNCQLDLQRGSVTDFELSAGLAERFSD